MRHFHSGGAHDSHGYPRASAAPARDDPITKATAQPPAACLGGTSSTATQALCVQFAAAARLRGVEPHSMPRPSAAGALGPAGKGALVGLGIGLGVGLIAGLVVGPGCEEGHAGCTAGLILGGAAVGAGVGALVGAVAGQD
jgi:hypothetical protein